MDPESKIYPVVTMSAPKPLPKESDWPIYIPVSVVIKAPREKVWEVLMNFEAYPLWNPYIRDATVTDASKNPLRNDQISAGHKLVVKVQTPPTMDPTAKPPRTLAETVVHVAPGHQLVYGSSPSTPRLLFGSQRWHVLSDVPGGTKYEIVSYMSGVGGSLAMMMMRKALVDGITAMAEGVKARCERR
ncbi:hypothetical protein R3P38DRAFT_2935067 [Favolaschia claudopus]|uniref:SRPBCC domain-containing protein n=1 Tax=Favolaschia claudopus TaxID=2862362 RepID=A0AAW0BP37_9AGAR